MEDRVQTYVNFIVESDRAFRRQDRDRLRAVLAQRGAKISAWHQEQAGDMHLQAVRTSVALSVKEFEQMLWTVAGSGTLSCYDNDPLDLQDGIRQLLRDHNGAVPPAALRTLLNTWLPFDRSDTSDWEDEMFGSDCRDSLRGELWQLVLLADLLGSDVVGSSAQLTALIDVNFAVKRSTSVRRAR